MFAFESLPAVLTSGVPVPAGVPVVGQLQFPGASGGLAGVLQSVAIDLASILGPTPLSQVSTQFTNSVATISGQLGAFTPTDQMSLPIPTSFDASILTSNLLFPLVGVTCTLDPGSVPTVATTPPTTPAAPGVILGPDGTVLAGQQTAVVKARGAKRLRVGQKAVVIVKVRTSARQAGVGDVVATLGGKAVTRTLAGGKARFVFKGLKPGVRTITLAFAGNAYTEAATKRFTVRVRR